MQNLTEIVSQFNSSLNGLVWGLPMMALIIGSGLYFSIRTGFPQLRKFGYAMKNTIGKAFSYGKIKDKGAVSPFQAVTTALAGTMGTGNIAGVAGAIALGGPGAIFWMWVSAFFGMTTKYAEIVLAVKFRKRNSEGDWVGGPMYYITGGLGKGFKWLAVLFSIFGAIAALGIGNMVQVNTAANALVALAHEFSTDPVMSGDAIDMTLRLAVGLIISIIAALVLLGGIKRIGSVTEKIIPAISILYIIGAVFIIFLNIGKITSVLEAIVVGAFAPDAVLGGAFGVGIVQSMRYGIGRGVFSNEAGLGSSPIAHAATSETDPVKQGLFGIFEVFADTIVVCTLTALVILMSGVSVSFGHAASAELTISAFATAFGGKTAGVFIAIETAFFAISTILSWSIYGCRCAEYLFGTRAISTYKVVYIVFIIIGAGLQMGLAWEIADTLNGLMAIPNLIAILALSGYVLKATKEHFRK
ncbi:MAG: sodium:alanine symporter family protein [Firmicutes bacterium HGW-Firmicutes-16]|nr:MAG: sodium:alanine symporter family protein [Firmicutes bacterium HGW-Firmicutes-16]